MMIEIKTKEEKDELLRGIRLCEKYALPFTADLSNIKEKLESF